MIRKIIIVVLTGSAVAIAICGVLGSVVTERNLIKAWQVDAYRYVMMQVSIGELSVMYVTENAPEKSEYRFGWGPIGFLRAPMFLDPDRSYSSMAYAAYIPSWLATIVLGVYPAFVFVKWRRVHRRRKRGLCVTCGYDLRGSPARCPECGAGIKMP